MGKETSGGIYYKGGYLPERRLYLVFDVRASIHSLVCMFNGRPSCRFDLCLTVDLSPDEASGGYYVMALSSHQRLCKRLLSASPCNHRPSLA